MFICEPHHDKWNMDTGCPYCREDKLEAEVAGASQVAKEDYNRWEDALVKLEAENAKLKAREEVQKTLTAEYKRTAFELNKEVERLEAKIAAAIAIGYASSGWAVYGQMKKALEAGNEETKDQ